MKKKTNPLGVSAIKKEADRVRKEYNAPLDSFFPIYEYITDLADKGLLTYQILEDDNPIFEEGEYGKYDPITNTIYVKDCVDEELCDDIGRARFTLAHELFHYIQIQVLKFEVVEVEEIEKSYEDAEWQANEFAAQLLIPQEYTTLEVEEIMEKFGVSEECALYRKVKTKNRNKDKKNG